MRAALLDPEGGLVELSRPGLWLSCSKALSRFGEERALAAEGFLAHDARGRRGVEALFELCAAAGPGAGLPPWDGHYSLAYARTKEGTLLLRRDPGGGERLFYLLQGDLLLFASSIRPLLASGLAGRCLDAETAREQLLNKFIVFGGRTLWTGVRELPPGRTLEAGPGGARLLPPAFPAAPAALDPAGFPKRLREALRDSAARAIGAEGRAAVALSGGGDSAAVAFCAAEAVGAGNVHAFTYAFDDPSHACELERAEAFCRRLGLRHRTLRIRLEDYLDSLPEALWRMEHPFDLKHGPQAMLLSRFIRQEGFRSFLTGNGLEQCLGIFSHDRYLAHLARSLARLPAPRLTLGHWRAKAFREGPRPLLSLLLGALPGLPAPPPAELYYLVLCVLRRRGMLESVSDFYPEDLRPWADGLSASPRVREAIFELATLPLESALRRLVFDFFSTRCSIRPIQKAAREAGAAPLSPPFFGSVLALGEEAYALTEGDVSSARGLRLRAMSDAFEGAPEFSPKPSLIELSQTVVSPAWHREALARAGRTLGKTPPVLEGLSEQDARLAARRFPENLLTLALWHALFIAREPAAAPPCWDSLKS